MAHHALVQLVSTVLASPPVQVATRTLKRVPWIREFVGGNQWASTRHRLVLHLGPRKNEVFTRFLRVPTQYEALTGPVLDFLAPAVADRPLTILDVGCSTGAEPYSIASMLRRRRPEVDFSIAAYDFNPEMIAKAKRGWYHREEIHCAEPPPPDFIAATFEQRDRGYAVKSELARHVSFDVGDLFDPQWIARAGQADIVCAQNVLINFTRPQARRAFANLCQLLRPRAVLFIDGMDLDIRQQMTRDYGLIPLEFRVREIHEDARVIRGSGWPWHYWGLEPFAEGRDWRRYATVFLHERALMD